MATFYPVMPGTFSLLLVPEADLDALADPVFRVGEGDLLLVRYQGVPFVVGDLPDGTSEGERLAIVANVEYELRRAGVPVTGYWYTSALDHSGRAPYSWRRAAKAFLRGFVQPFTSIANLRR